MDRLIGQAGTDFDLELFVEVQNVHSSERQHHVDLQLSNSDVWLEPAELELRWFGAETAIHPDSVVELLLG